MKRSEHINLAIMRKAMPPLNPLRLRLAALFAGMGLLSACGSEEALVYESVQDCVLDNFGELSQCERAYEAAERQWWVSAPRYVELGDCEEEFGDQNCRQVGYEYLPLMAGFMLPAYFDDDDDWDYKKSKGLGRSKARRSAFHNQWVSAAGAVLGAKAGKVSVDAAAFKSSAVGKVMRRGGFGRTVSQASSRRSGG